MTVIYFIAFIVIMSAIGIYSCRFSKKTQIDYLLASRSISPWQTALSSLATTYSGFAYIGLIGYVWVQGLSGIWLTIFWLLGELVAVLYVPKRAHRISVREKALSYGGLLASHNGTNFKSVNVLSTLITVLFLAIYASAQLNAGGKTLHIVLGWQHNFGIFFGYAIILGYCFAGGIRASIWTDSVQFITMLFSMSALVVIELNALGGWQQFWQKITAISPEYGQFFPDSMGGFFTIIIFFLGYFFAGLGIAGQPHIVIRYMAMRKEQYGRRMLYYYYPMTLLFILLVFFSALLTRVYFAEIDTPHWSRFDPETALPKFASDFLPPFLIAFILAGIFSAIISTVDSQVLSCSASLSYDLRKQDSNKTASAWRNKIATIIMATLVLILSIFAHESVFTLVIVAWSTLAASFAPLLAFRLLNFKVTEKQALITILTGLLTNILWVLIGHKFVYEGLIGMLAGTAIFLVIHFVNKKQPS